ncbi:CCA tRNA nucleotidyltransferase [Cohnella sp. CBP 2801]|uniref:CCA tRNA nucleotidyltransferase n=2 Tax=Cohnella zeiphila TaxID=2761120 RepID=A0A7X0ST01_9BACL|nr:CCA tRNA nucleotidyltransferase [Cohnella zeiphila]
MKLIASIEEAGFAAYLVGGCVRDRLLGRALRDIDIATSAFPEQVTAIFGKVVPTGLKHGTVTVLEDGCPFEVTTFRRETAYSDGRHPDEVAFVPDLRTDLSRRDFTFNAMAVGSDGCLVDPFEGEADLRRRVVRCVGDARERFGEDALRMLRAIRFAAELRFELDEELRSGLRAQRERLALVAMERIGAELDKMAGGADPGRAFALLADSGLTRHAKETVAAALPGRAELPPDARWSELDDENARWAVLLLAAGMDAAGAGELARSLRFNGKRAARLAAALRVDGDLREAGFWEATDEAGRRRIWIRTALACGTEAAGLWLQAMRAAPSLAARRAAGGCAYWQPERLAAWLREMPAASVSGLAVRGDELVRLTGRKPGPWVAAALASLLERVALGELPNEAGPLLQAASSFTGEREGEAGRI